MWNQNQKEYRSNEHTGQESSSYARPPPPMSPAHPLSAPLPSPSASPTPIFGPTVAEIISGTAHGGRNRFGGGMACVGNFGDFANWTGHVFAAANTYGCGRLAWDPMVSADDVNTEWARLTFPPASADDAAAATGVEAAAGVHTADGLDHNASSIPEAATSTDVAAAAASSAVVATAVHILNRTWLVYEGA